VTFEPSSHLKILIIAKPMRSRRPERVELDSRTACIEHRDYAKTVSDVKHCWTRNDTGVAKGAQHQLYHINAPSHARVKGCHDDLAKD
jgi:hypothetical protein